MLQALLPMVPALLLAAAVLARASTRAGARLGVLAWLATVAATLGAVALALASRSVDPQPLQLVLLPWAGSVFDSSVALSAQPLAAAVLFLVAALGFLACSHAVAVGAVGDVAPALAVAAASSLFVLATASPLGLVFAWLVLDLTLFVVVGGSRHALVAGQLGLAMVLAAVVTLPWQSTLGAAAPATAPYASLTGAGRFWLVSAGAIRMGLYPVWWAVPPTDRDRPWASLGTRLAPIAAGGYLVLLVSALSPLGQGLTMPVQLPTLGSMLIASLLAMLAANRSEAWDWQTAAQAALLLMAALIGGQIGQAVGLLVLVDLLLVRAGLLLADEVAGDPRATAASRLLALAAAGAPPTLGFAARWLLYRDLLYSGMGLAVFVIVVATTITTSRLWDTLRLPRPRRAGGRRTLTAVLALVALELSLGLALPALGGLLAAVSGTSLPSPIALAWAGLTARSTLTVTLVLLAAGLLPAILAPVLPHDPQVATDARRRMVRRAVRATGAATAAASLVVRLGELVARVLGLLESRRAMAWTVMAATAIGVAMVVGGQGSPVEGGASGPLGLAVFALAAVVGIAMVLGRSPGLTVGALAAGYTLAAAVQWLSEVPPQVALMELLGGWMAAAILAVGVLQAPIDRRLVGAARRLAAVGAARDEEGLVLPALALFVALVVGSGLQSSALATQLPVAVLRPAFVLAAAGVLAGVFARSPLRLAAGVLTALAGFQMAYARLDPGLLISAGLAAFQLLFAVVASHFVAMPGRDEGAR